MFSARSQVLKIFHNIFRNSIPLTNRSICISASCNGKCSKYVAPTRIALQKRVDTLKEKNLYPSPRRSEFLDWNFEAELYCFGKRLNEEFDNTLLKEALTENCYLLSLQKERTDHSFSDISSEMKDNKELSNVGFVLIEDFCKKYLRGAWPKLPEEGIQCLTDYLLSSDVLGKVGEGIGLKDLILVKSYPPTPDVYARCFAATVACINKTSGLEACHKFILDFVVTQLLGKDLWDIWKVEDPFLLLKELHKRVDISPPEPRILGELGKNTIEAVFHVGIYVDQELVGSGYGENLNTGLTVAALDTMGRYFNSTLSSAPLPINEGLQALTLKDVPNFSLYEYTIR